MNPNLIGLTGEKDKSYKINTMLHSSFIEISEFDSQSEKIGIY